LTNASASGIPARLKPTMSDVDEELAHEEAFPRLTRELLAVLEAAGERRTLTQGEVLSRAADSPSTCDCCARWPGPHDPRPDHR
jgi:hypothetical protein